jgi:hypothetical protein
MNFFPILFASACYFYFLASTLSASEWVSSSEEHGRFYRAKLITENSEDLLEIEAYRDGQLISNYKIPAEDILIYWAKGKKLASIERVPAGSHKTAASFVVINTKDHCRFWMQQYKPIALEAEDGMVALLENFQAKKIYVERYDFFTGEWVTKTVYRQGIGIARQDALTGEIANLSGEHAHVYVSREEIKKMRNAREMFEQALPI